MPPSEHPPRSARFLQLPSLPAPVSQVARGLASGFFLAAVAWLTAACSGPPAESPTAAPSAPVRASEGGVPIRYHLSFRGAARHMVEVEARIAPHLLDGGHLELMMAVWTPGSYLVREYSRHVEGVVAHELDGTPLAVVKSAKNRWIVDGASGTGEVVVRYRIYCREMTVRTNFVDVDMAMLNGAPTFLTPVGAEALPREIRLELPENWSGSATGLPPHPSGDLHHFLAADLDTLFDSPIVAGELAVTSFDVEGVRHELVNLGDTTFLDAEQQLADVERLTRTQVEFWGQIPYERYVFLNVIGESGGGLEHRDSTLMLTSRWRLGDPEGYRRWLGLVSHELFHAWNVKRLRPAPLGPFDYENEAYTRSLWIAEGITSYYTPLLLLRAGLIDLDAYLERLSGTIEAVESVPGARVRSVADASFDAWIKHYRPDENTRNTTVSYYSKGAVLGFLLDMSVRRGTGGERSLDDVMLLAYDRYSAERGFTPGEFREAVVEVAGTGNRDEIEAFFDRYVDGTEDLDYGPALDWLGLRFAEPSTNGTSSEQGSEEDDGPTPGWLGAEHEERDGRLMVTGVPRDTPAHRFGLNVDDEMLALEGYRVDAEDLDERLRFFPPGTEAELLVSRRGRLRTLAITLGEAPERSRRLEVDPEAPARAARRRAWSGG